MTILDRVRRIVADALDLPLESVTAETPFYDLADSMEDIEIVMGIEAEFALELSEKASAEIMAVARTVGDLVAYLDERLR